MVSAVVKTVFAETDREQAHARWREVADTAGAAGVEVAQEVLVETQGAVLPLVPYLDTLRWVFIALALAGICVVPPERSLFTRRSDRSSPR